MGDGFDRLMERWEKFEREHTKVRNDDMFRWFDEQGLWLLQEYCKNCAELKYVVSESGIDVNITTKDLLLMTDLDKELLKILNLSATCSIKAVGEQLEISLWFRGWKWLEKGSCLSGATEVE